MRSWGRAFILLLAGGPGCALLYDFEASGGAGATATNGSSTRGSGPTTGSTPDASAAATTASGVSCTPSLCFGGACVDGACDPIDIVLEGRARAIHVNGDTGSVAVITSRDEGATGIGVSVVGETGLLYDTGPIPSSQSDWPTSFVAHDADEVLVILAQATQVVRHASGGWGERVSFATMPPTGTNNKLNAMLPVGGKWFAVSQTAIVSMTPAVGSDWSFEKTPAPGAPPTAEGHSLVRHGPGVYFFSLYQTDPSGGIAQVDLEETIAPSFTKPGLAFASGLASNGTWVAVRSIAAANVRDLVSLWNPTSGNVREVARTPQTSRQGVAIDRNHVYFDGAIAGQPAAVFRCELDVLETDSPETDPRCKILVEDDQAGVFTIGGVGSALLDAGTGSERFLVCFARLNKLTCQVTF